MTARELARKVLERVEREGAWATLALDAELDRSGLAERDRRLAAELVYGVLRNRSRIDRALAAHANLKHTPPRVLVALRVAAHQLLFLDRVPDYAAVDDAVRAVRASGEEGGAKLAGFCNAVLRKLAPGKEPAMPPDLRGRLQVEHSMPAWIFDELVATAGAALPEVCAAFAQQAPLIGRVNRRRTTRDALIEQLRTDGVTATPMVPATGGLEAPDAFIIDGGDPSRMATFQAGLWTVQDYGAQLVAQLAAPREGQRILDACAGVGGKSTHLAELADDRAPIDAADQSRTKLDLLQVSAERLGLGSITTHACDLLDPAAPLAATYDLIVLDAPCTGLGVLRRHPDAKWRLKATDVPRLAKLQAMLLDALVPRLAPGGALVYSVCTFTRAEGPAQIRALVERTGLRLVTEHRTWPPDGDAFYLARLER